jgi:hypothetical protein
LSGLEFNDAGQCLVDGSEPVDLADAFVITSFLLRDLIVQHRDRLPVVQQHGPVFGEGIAQCYSQVFLAPVGMLAAAGDAGAALEISFVPTMPAWGRGAQVIVSGSQFPDAEAGCRAGKDSIDRALRDSGSAQCTG